MEYLNLINRFWAEDEYQSFSAVETRLYFFLLNLANRSYWKEWMEYSDTKLTANIGVSVSVIRNARNRLQDANLIKFEVGGKGFRVKTRYQILTPNDNPNQYPSLHPNQHPNLEPYNIKIKTKTKNNINGGKNEFSKRAYVSSGSDFD